MDLERCFLTVPFATPEAVELSQWRGVRIWGCPSSAKVSHMMRDSFMLIKSAPSSASSVDDAKNLRMVHSL